MRNSFFQSFALAAVLNRIVLVLVWRRPGRAALGLAPFLAAVSVTFGVMAMSGVSLRALNVSIGAIVVGLGIDYPIRIIERFYQARTRGAGAITAAHRVAGTRCLIRIRH